MDSAAGIGALVSRALLADPELLPEALAAVELPEGLRAWMAERAEHAAARQNS